MGKGAILESLHDVINVEGKKEYKSVYKKASRSDNLRYSFIFVFISRPAAVFVVTYIF